MFLGLLALHSVLKLPDLTDQVFRVGVMTAVLWFVARPVIDLRLQHAWASAGLGVMVFLIWVGPDLMFPEYRHHWLFENSITGVAQTSLAVASQNNPLVLGLRTLRAVIIVPIAEELFWRAWLMRWLVASDFKKIELGTYTPLSFWLVAVLFASEHGAYWDVGLVAGILYNWWMVRTKSLGDLILAHAVTNGCLSVYIIAAGKWEYWL